MKYIYFNRSKWATWEVGRWELLTFDPELYSQKGNKVFLDICRPKSADGIPNPQISPSST